MKYQSKKVGTGWSDDRNKDVRSSIVFNIYQKDNATLGWRMQNSAPTVIKSNINKMKKKKTSKKL